MRADYGIAAMLRHCNNGQHDLLLALDDYYPPPETVEGDNCIHYRFQDGSTLTLEKLPAFLTRQAD